MDRKRDHGGGLDAAMAQFGGNRAEWLDLSTGINPEPYPIPTIHADAWTALPDVSAATALVDAARVFWRVPMDRAILAVPGASAAISHIPLLAPAARVAIAGPTYNEHAASFVAAGWEVSQIDDAVTASVHVHPNNPDGRLFDACDLRGHLRIIDESFCDVTPDASLMDATAHEGTLILKSFGKFWGLAGLRLGFVIGHQNLINQIAEMLGPWPVSGPALYIGAHALRDEMWAKTTRQRLTHDASRLDDLMTQAGAHLVGGTPLFRLYDLKDASLMYKQLAHQHILSRVFPYNKRWLRLGLPHAASWSRVEAALA